MIRGFFISFFGKCLFGLALLWLAGFFWFIKLIPGAPEELPARADAIVVLTGGGKRLERGIELLNEGRARRMLVSGVGIGATLPELLASQQVAAATIDALQKNFSAISLGYAADSTLANASETRDWMEKHKLKSLFLVTSNYHMPRSLMEFAAAMPDAALHPTSVSPDDLLLAHWWNDDETLKTLLVEYHKFLVVWFRIRSRGA